MIYDNEDAPETTFISWDKPLTATAHRTLTSLMDRYSDDKGQPLMKFDSNPEDPNDGWVALHIPKTLRPTFMDEQIAKEETSLLSGTPISRGA